MEPGEGGVRGAPLLEGKMVHIPDVLEDPEYIAMKPQRVGRVPDDPSAFRFCGKACLSRCSCCTAPHGSSLHGKAD